MEKCKTGEIGFSRDFRVEWLYFQLDIINPSQLGFEILPLDYLTVVILEYPLLVINTLTSFNLGTLVFYLIPLDFYHQ